MMRQLCNARRLFQSGVVNRRTSVAVTIPRKWSRVAILRRERIPDQLVRSERRAILREHSASIADTCWIDVAAYEDGIKRRRWEGGQSKHDLGFPLLRKLLSQSPLSALT